MIVENYDLPNENEGCVEKSTLIAFLESLNMDKDKNEQELFNYAKSSLEKTSSVVDIHLYISHS
jgi:hypothetical protein